MRMASILIFSDDSFSGGFDKVFQLTYIGDAARLLNLLYRIIASTFVLLSNTKKIIMANSIDRMILERKHAIENALNYPDIQKKLAAFTYNRKKLLKGKALNEKVGLLQIVKKDNYGSQVNSTDFLKENLEETKTIYNEHVALARMTYKKTGECNSGWISTGQGRDEKKSGWHRQRSYIVR